MIMIIILTNMMIKWRVYHDKINDLKYNRWDGKKVNDKFKQVYQSCTWGTHFEECCKIDFSDEIMESCGIAELVNTNANYI